MERPVEWKFIINYAAGYRVEDEHGNILVSDLSSTNVMREAWVLAGKYDKLVQITKWAETVDGLEPEMPTSQPAHLRCDVHLKADR